MDISGLNFTKKSTRVGGGLPACVDVSVTSQGSGKAVAFSFSSWAYGLMGSPKALNAALGGTSIYFLESSTKTGFVVNQNGPAARAYCRFPADQLATQYSYIGYYDLKWDRNRELWYIDLSKRKQD